MASSCASCASSLFTGVRVGNVHLSTNKLPEPNCRRGRTILIRRLNTWRISHTIYTRAAELLVSDFSFIKNSDGGLSRWRGLANQGAAC